MEVVGMVVFVAWVAFFGFVGWRLGKWNLRRQARAKERQWEHEADMLAWEHQVKSDHLRNRGIL
ncbi:hypothetical protein GTC6_05532 [Gordonia terrae C-6]|uniref:Uncharacterized protein n=1 Tax=Gordonia terrae C-6 TaxID=1316928 RepID=R7YCS9_9ACTN|nr:hypothetical protein [Gordonia terrae]EON33803.1 hypothetical protein GTC6_05532 [Gordonia terrae C-6]